VGPTVDLEDVETLPGLEPRLHGRPARSQSLYRLGYRVKVYKTFISQGFLFCVCGRKIWPLTPCEEHKLQMFDKNGAKENIWTQER
jgi:hypothetical protein